MVVVGDNFASLFDYLIHDYVHPPLYYITLLGYFEVVGAGAYEGRLLSVLFGTASIPVMYFIGRALYSTRTGLIAALLLAVSQIGVMYSQEMRMYAQQIFMVYLALLFFILAARHQKIWAWWAFIITATLAIYSHYYSVYLIGALFAWALIERRTISLAWTLSGALLVIVLFIPWLASGVVEYAITNPKGMPAVQPYWYSTTWDTAFHSLNRYNNGSLTSVLHQEGLPYAYFAGAFLFSAYAWISVSMRQGTRPAWWMAIVWSGGAGVVALFSLLSHGATSGVGLTLIVLARGLQWAARTGAITSGWPAILGSDRAWLTLLISASVTALWVAVPGWILFVLGVLLGTSVYQYLASSPKFDDIKTSPRNSHLQYGTLLIVLAWMIPFAMPLITGIFEVQYTIRYTVTALPAYLLLVAQGLASIRVPIWRGSVIVLCVIYSLLSLKTNYFQPYKENWRDAMSQLSDNYLAGDCVIVSASAPMSTNMWEFYGSKKMQHDVRVIAREDHAREVSECQRIWVLGYLRTPINVNESNTLKAFVEKTHRKIHGQEFFWTELVLYEPGE